MNGKSLTCIVCPAGCRISIEAEGKSWKIEGNKCPRGKTYAIAEMTDPRRSVSAVIRTKSVSLPYAPVRTDKPIKQELVFKLLEAIYSLEIEGPLQSGAVIIPDFENSGVNVILTREIYHE